MATIADPTSFKATTWSRGIARRFGLAGFARWWLRELGAAMPPRLAAALARRRARPVLAFEGSRATLWQPSQADGHMRVIAVADIPLYADAETVAAAGRAALAPLIRAANGTAPQVIVALSPRASLRKTLTLPMALEDHLHQSLAYDLDRHTPFKAEELYFDAVVTDRDPVHNTLRVDLAAARRAVVDPIVRQAESFGARVIAVAVDPPATASSSPLNLLPEDRREPTLAWARWRLVVPALLLAAGALAALYLPIWQKREQAIALNQLADQARERAGISEALRTELERRVDEYNFALDRKYAFPGVVEVLEDVTRILPDDTWLTQLEVHTMRGKDAQRDLALRGESGNAGQLVSLLENSKLFTQAAPRSPTTKIQPGPGEIFDVGAKLRPQARPAPLALDMVPPPAPAAPTASAPAPVAAPAANPSPSGARSSTPAAGPSAASRPTGPGSPPAGAGATRNRAAPAPPAPAATPAPAAPAQTVDPFAAPVTPGNAPVQAPPPAVPIAPPEPDEGATPQDEGNGG